MASYPRTGSNLNSRTHTGLSTQIVILVNNEPVGSIKSFSMRQDRPMEEVTEVGTDGIIEVVPSGPTTYSLSCDRVVFDGLSVTEAFSRAFRNIKSQRIPFDIVVIDQFTGTGDDAIITTYLGCWFKSIDKSYDSGSYVITERAEIVAEDVMELRGGDAVAKSQGVGGSRQISGVQFDAIEMEADTGARRGGLDFPGLITATY